VLAKWEESNDNNESKATSDKILKSAGVWSQEPGFMHHGSLLVDSGYQLFTPDVLHGLGRIMRDTFGMFMACLAKQKGSITQFSNRIKAQDRFRPQGRVAFHVFLAACCNEQLFE
jgi:hypothetical protein